MTGATIIITTAHGNALLPTFPGWGEPIEVCRQHMRPIVEGEMGVITSVESHGMNPWRRYSVRFMDGSRAYGVYPTDVQMVSA